MLRIPLVAAVVITLSACVGPQTRPDVALDPKLVRSTWLAAQERLSRLEAWSIKGKAVIRSAEQSGTVSLFWQQREANNFALKLIAPFGRGTLDIKSDERGVSMVDAQGKLHRAATARGLVWLKTGWEVPVEDMQNWVLGIADDPKNPSLRVDGEGRTLSFSSKGWDVSYPAYRKVMTEHGELFLPRKVYIQSRDLVLKLVVSDWGLGIV